MRQNQHSSGWAGTPTTTWCANEHLSCLHRFCMAQYGQEIGSGTELLEAEDGGRPLSPAALPSLTESASLAGGDDGSCLSYISHGLSRQEGERREESES